MDIALDEVIHFDAIASDAAGNAQDADSTPTFAVYEEATDTDIGVGGNLTKRTSLTGNYRGTFTLSAANGFEVGKWYSVIGSATIDAVTTKGVLKHFRVAAAESVAGHPKVDQAYWLGVAPLALSSQRVQSHLGGGDSNVLTAAMAAADFGAELQALITGGAYPLSTDANGRTRIVDGTGAGELDTLSGTVLLRAATQSSIDAIEADTNEMQGDLTNGGRLDLIFDIIAADTTTDLPTLITDRSRLAAEYATKLDGGYVDDFVYYWADGAAGQVSGVNGTIGNPSSNGVDMYAIGVARGRKRFKLLKPLSATGAPNIFGSPAISFEGSHFDLNGCEVDFNADTSFAGDDIVINSYRVTTTACVFKNGTIYHPSPSYGDYYIDVVLYHYGSTISPMKISGAYPPYFKACGLPKKVQFQTNFDLPTRWAVWYYCYNFGFAETVEVDFNSKFVQLRISPWTGNLIFKGMTDDSGSIPAVILHGYGKLTINDDCTHGTIQVTSHVEVFAENGSAWVKSSSLSVQSQ